MKPSLGSVTIDLPSLLETRLLVQANSGGGKSYCLRRLLEQTSNGVQQIVIDPEGEFATLREKFDYIICAPQGADAVATPATAAALARAVWESGTSAIVDIYELKAHERILFVRRFCEALVNAPKRIWHPTLVVIDEVHMFAPQVGSAESGPAVIDLATRGRKRGLALVGATQRLSKLHKDVAAELLNKLIGRTGLDVDVQRAADELGMTRANALIALRDLQPGEFFAFGPALTRSVEKITIGAVATTHPKTGQRALIAPPPASASVRAKLAKLEGIQREAVEEAHTVEVLKKHNAQLQRDLATAEKRAGQAGIAEAEVQRRENAARTAGFREGSKTSPPSDSRAIDALQAIVRITMKVLDGRDPASVAQLASAAPRAIRAAIASTSPAPPPGPTSDGVSTPQQKILDTLAQLHLFGVDAPSKEMIAAHAGVSPTSGGYFNNLGKLRTQGLIEYPAGGTAALTAAGREVANKPTKAPTLADLHESWLRVVPAPQAAILRVLIEHHPKSMPKDELADTVGVSRTSGGYFNNLGRLRTLGAIDYPEKGTARAASLLFPVKR